MPPEEDDASYLDAPPEIPWQKIIGQRHVLIHEYGDIEHELIWMTVTIHGNNDRVRQWEYDNLSCVPGQIQVRN